MFDKEIFLFKVSEEEQACVTHPKDCESCERMFDDDLSTLQKLDSGDEMYPKIQRLEVNQSCINTSDVSCCFNETTHPEFA